MGAAVAMAVKRLLNVVFLASVVFLLLALLAFIGASGETKDTEYFVVKYLNPCLFVSVSVGVANYILFGKFRLWNSFKDAEKNDGNA